MVKRRRIGPLPDQRSQGWRQITMLATVIIGLPVIAFSDLTAVERKFLPWCDDIDTAKAECRERWIDLGGHPDLLVPWASVILMIDMSAVVVAVLLIRRLWP